MNNKLINIIFGVLFLIMGICAVIDSFAFYDVFPADKPIYIITILSIHAGQIYAFYCGIWAYRQGNVILSIISLTSSGVITFGSFIFSIAIHYDAITEFFSFII